MSDSELSRRGFIGTTGGVTAGVAFAGLTAGGAQGAAGANQRLSIGIVGPGGRGTSLLRTFFSLGKESRADLTAVCDLWGRNRDRSSAMVKQQGGSAPRGFNRLQD